MPLLVTSGYEWRRHIYFCEGRITVRPARLFGNQSSYRAETRPLAMAWSFEVRCLLLYALTERVFGSHFRGAIFMVRPSPVGGENEVSDG